MLLEMKDISKSFYRINVLDCVHFQLEHGEVHALVGTNGAGKTTLMKILSGIHEPDEGEIRIENKKVSIRSPIEAQRCGISIIHQEPELVPDLSIAENIFLGAEPSMLNLFVNSYQMKKRTQQLMKLMGCNLHPNTLIRDISHHEQYLVAIAKALSLQSKILIMDEPTSSISDIERDSLFKLIRAFKEQGVGIIYITHKLKEISLICDRITVLRDGKHVITREVHGLDENDAIKLMIGRELKLYFPPAITHKGESLLRVDKLTRKPWFQEVSFELREGEILGLVGLVGSGRTELAKTIFGQNQRDSGRVFWRNHEVMFKNPKQAIRHHFGYVNENRIESGLFMNMSISENLSISSMERFNRWHFIRLQAEQESALNTIIDLDIKIKHLKQEIKYLSGGNQQKVVLGKWLVADCELYLLDEPTRGIDVASKSEIYVWIHELAQQGKGVMLISSDVSELIGLCTRILVMHEGRIIDEIMHEDASEERITQMMQQ